MFDMALIIGNLCSLFGTLSDSFSSTRKTANGVLTMQTVSQVFFGIGSVFLKGYSAAVQSAVSILRNIATIKGVNSRVLWLVLTLSGVVFGLVFNNLGLLGLLPVISNLEYTIAVFSFRKNPRMLKAAFFINVSLFTIFNFFIYNFVGAISNCVVLASIVYSLIKEGKQ